jgi:transposase
MPIIDEVQTAARYLLLSPYLDERQRRFWVACEAINSGHGAISALSRATGIHRKTIRSGIADLSSCSPPKPDTTKQRRPGAGRKPLTAHTPQLAKALDSLMEPYTSGDPMRPLRWTCKSTQKLAAQLTSQGFKISARSISKLLKEQGYSLQSNRKRHEGSHHPDRNAQFEYINTMVEEFQKRGSPVISVDTKKKELVGLYKNSGQEWQPKGQPLEVSAYDFIDPEKGKAIPYGIYDPILNQGWVSVGVDHDTAEFAVSSIARWWSQMGKRAYPQAHEILIMADGGGSNGSRSRLWKYALHQWAQREQLKIVVCHFPPGTSKWNKIEHRMFCHISQNWRGKPLISHEIIVELIGSTCTAKGLKIRAELDQASYLTGKKISDEQLTELKLERADFHGEWNYLIHPY